MYDILELNKKLVPELRDIAKELNIKKFEALKNQDLVYKILDTQAIQEAEKAERKSVVKEPNKEENGTKSFLVKKSFSSENKNTQQEDLRGNRPRRERIEPIFKRIEDVFLHRFTLIQVTHRSCSDKLTSDDMT